MGTREVKARILVVDDDARIRQSIGRILASAGYECAMAATVREARGLLQAGGTDLLVCDVRLPGESGLDLVASLPEVDDPCVLIISGEGDPLIAEVAIEKGAYGYLVKPFDSQELLINVSNALHRRRLEERDRRHRAILQAAVEERSREMAEVISRLERSRDELSRSRRETINRLSRALEFRDAETGGHVERIAETSALLAQRLDVAKPRVELLRAASPMHDIGKIGLPDWLLLKPGPLDPSERRAMEQHATIGFRILSGSESDLLDLAAKIALTHHERFDGSGYPNGLKGYGVPLEGRVVAVADVFDALTNDRVYRPAYRHEDALEIMRQGRGTQLDPDVLDCMLDGFDERIALGEPLADMPTPLAAIA